MSGWAGAQNLHAESGKAIMYSGMTDCFRRTVQEEGMRALFKVIITSLMSHHTGQFPSTCKAKHLKRLLIFCVLQRGLRYCCHLNCANLAVLALHTLQYVEALHRVQCMQAYNDLCMVGYRD